MNPVASVDNLYVHFPFCRRKCSYCALYSRVGATEGERREYVARLAALVCECGFSGRRLKTVYFGGGSPALCDLEPLLAALSADEFTVELHPLDVTDERMRRLAGGGVNRISMGVQSLDDATLAHMGRGYTADGARRAFEIVRRHVGNAGIDLIVGYPGERLDRTGELGGWGLEHCSVYALQNERGLKDVPDDDTALDRLNGVARILDAMGLERYEISNYARPGRACRHNLAVWRGEDYAGLGDGACGRLGLERTRNFGGRHPVTETLSPARDETERTIFRLRTREGLDASRHPEWVSALATFVREGLLTASGATYRLTARGMEVCDTILAALV